MISDSEFGGAPPLIMIDSARRHSSIRHSSESTSAMRVRPAGGAEDPPDAVDRRRRDGEFETVGRGTGTLAILRRETRDARDGLG